MRCKRCAKLEAELEFHELSTPHVDSLSQEGFRRKISQIITGPSGSGKGILLQSMILDIYRNVSERVYVWSPSISVDSNWLPVRHYVQNELKVDFPKKKCFFDEYIPEELEGVIKQQHKVIEYQ